MTSPHELDVSHLPPDALDTRSPAWWGNTLLMIIETMTVALLIMSYLYLWRNDRLTSWPPPKTSTAESILDPLPDLGLATIEVLLLLASCVLMALVDLHARRRFRLMETLRVSEPNEAPEHLRPRIRPTGVGVALGLLLATGILVVVLRFLEFKGLKFAWNENAYASLIWTIVGMHLTYLLLAVIEVAIVFAWFLIYGFGESLAFDVTLTAAYWYWTAGTWLVLYMVVYWLPRIV